MFYVLAYLTMKIQIDAGPDKIIFLAPL